MEKVVAQERKGSIVKIAAVKPVAPSPNRAQTPVSSPIVVPPKPEVVPAAVTHLPVKYAAAAAAPVEPKVGVIGSRPPLKGISFK